MRFSLRRMFLLVALVAMLLAASTWLWTWFQNEYYAQVSDLDAVLAEHPEIDKVWLSANPDVQLEVEDVYFTVKGKPGTTLYAYGLDGSSKQAFRERLERALLEKQPVPLPAHVEEHPH